MATDAPARPDSKRTEVGTMPHMGNGSEYQGCEPQDLTDNGICTQCGECCTNLLPISDSDIRRIRHYIKRHCIRPINHIPVLIQGPTLDMVCPFLDDKKPDRKCLIYPVHWTGSFFISFGKMHNPQKIGCVRSRS